MTTGGSTPPGWYQDPGDARQLRWWDGLTWTPHVAPAHAPPPPPTAPYGSPITHRVVTTTILAAAAIAGVFAAFALLRRAGLADDFNSNSGSVSLQQLQDADDLVQTAVILQLGAFLGAFVALAVCTHRLYKNLPALGAASLRYTTGWGAGAWFVPFLNFVRPKQIVNDIWRASDPDAPPQQGSGWHGRPVRPLLDLWWALFIGAALFTRLSAATAEDPTIEEIAASDRQGAVSSVILAVSMIVTLFVVRALVARQVERATTLGLDNPAGPGTQPPPGPT
jgi:hypothetical protein